MRTRLTCLFASVITARLCESRLYQRRVRVPLCEQLGDDRAPDLRDGQVLAELGTQPRGGRNFQRHVDALRGAPMTDRRRRVVDEAGVAEAVERTRLLQPVADAGGQPQRGPV